MRTGVGALVLITGLLVAGCGGGGSSPGVAHLGGGSPTSATASSSSARAADGGGDAPTLNASSGGGQGGGLSLVGGNGANLLKFAACMRANGEPDFPDPNAQGAIQFNPSTVNPQSTQFQAAQKKCAKYTPHGGQSLSPAQQAQFLAKAFVFSACMRSHGVPDFPDPSVSSRSAGFRIRGTAGSGLDPNSPIFQRAQKDCAADLPGKAGLPTLAKGPA